ncbi:MAG: hypothetical protein AAF141_06865 [Pseudomonadota bacterium]
MARASVMLMLMLMRVLMRVLVPVGVILAVTVPVSVIVALVVTVVPVSSPLGVEWLFNVPHMRAKPKQHLCNHVIALNQYATVFNLGRQMSIANLPGKAVEVARVPATNFKQ